MKVAAIQMNSSDQVDSNLTKTESLAIEAKNAGADICFLPENFAFMGHPKEILSSVMEDKETGPIQSFVSSIAKEHKIWIIAGSIPISDPQIGKALSRSVAFNENGEVEGYYDKVHLFDVEVNGKNTMNPRHLLQALKPNQSILHGVTSVCQFVMISGFQNSTGQRNLKTLKL